MLWWQINRILEEKKVKPKYLILENVDRLIKSPSNQRGRDMAIILKCLENLGYSVEWRVINGAEYGFPQRRRRLFLVGYYKTTKQFSKLKNDMEGWIESEGVISKSFPIKQISSFQRFDISKSDIKDISDNFNKTKKNSPFENCGCMVDGRIITSKVFPNFDGKYIHLENVLESGKVDEEFYIDEITENTSLQENKLKCSHYLISEFL